MDLITVAEAAKRSGLTEKQIRGRIKSGAIKAEREAKGGKTAAWLIDPASLEPAGADAQQDDRKKKTTSELKNLLTVAQIKRIQQQLESGRQKIIDEYAAECKAVSIEICAFFIGIVKRKLGLTKKQQGIWNKEIDKFRTKYETG